jgi:arylsulfatase A-like enzyme
MYAAGIDKPHRSVDVATDLAARFLKTNLGAAAPWCCFVSLIEPHDPYVATGESFRQYDVDSIPAPPNWSRRLDGLPGMYRKAARTFAGMTRRHKQEAAACYYASITEIDEYFGRLIGMVESAGELENTIVVQTSDHGDLMGAHGLYMKNLTGFEEAYNIPLIVSAPGMAKGASSTARVGLHDVGQTLLEAAGLETIATNESRSFLPVLREPAHGGFRTGFAENYGSRYTFTQRVIWDGPWKLVWNGFDFDELYNHDDDPYEMRNLAGEKAHEGQLRRMMELAWRYVRETGDEPLLRSQYPVLRLAAFGPGKG